MTVCKKCNGTGELRVPVEEHLGTVLYGTEQCDECDGTGEAQTNEEWLRTLPADEQVKEVLSRGFMTEKRTAEDFVEWLKEIHE